AWTNKPAHVALLREKLRANQPPTILQIDKNDCKGKNGGYSIDLIDKSIKIELAKFGAYHIFIVWENLIHKSAANIVKDFSSFYPCDDNWNRNLYCIFKKL